MDKPLFTEAELLADLGITATAKATSSKLATSLEPSNLPTTLGPLRVIF